jgi:chaperonin GroEL (HSP60 family)
MSKGTRGELTAAAGTVCDIVRTTLGPFGASKLVVEDGGRVTTTAVGAAVLDRLDVEDPSLTVLRAAASSFEERYGDGTGTVVALAGALLRAAHDLAGQGLHPTAVERGYRKATSVALSAVERSARPLSAVGVAPVAATAMTATRDPTARATVSGYVQRVVESLGREAFDRKQVKVATRLGGAGGETELVRGVVLEKEPVAEGMPRSVEGAGIALLSATVDVPRFGGETGVAGGDVAMEDASFEDRTALADREREVFRERLAAAREAGCDVVLTGMAVNDRVKRDVADARILAFQRVDDDDLRLLVRSTGAEVVPGLEQVTADTLGRGDVGLRREAGRDVVAVESDAGDPTHTLFCRAPDPRSVEAFRRSVESALSAVDLALSAGRVVPGGGAVGMAASHAVRDHARSVEGVEQLAVEAYADALRVVPRALATNAGLDGWDAVVRLHVAHSEGRDAVGIDCLTGEVTDVLAGDPIVQPVALERATLEAATELAVRLVRIDERLEATELDPDPDYRTDRPTPEHG